MAQYKGNLGKGRVVDADLTPNRNNSSKVVTVEYKTVSWGEIAKVWAKHITTFILFGAVLLVAIYAGLSATVLYNVNTGKGNFFVVRGTYVGGIIPAEQKVYASATDNLENTFLSNLQEGFMGVKNAVIVKTLAGPVSRIYVSPQLDYIMTVDDKNAIIDTFTGKVVGNVPTDGWLREQYIVECVYGASCQPGELLVLGQKQISGKVVTEFKAG